MLKILSTEQIRAGDEFTIQNEPIASIDLMERAAKACFDRIVHRYDKDRSFVILAGVGNNGGDALAIARMLVGEGYEVSTYVVRYSEKFSTDQQVNLDRLKELGQVVKYVLEEAQFPAISSSDVIIDGLFGSGLNRPAEGLASICIEQINASIADVVSIDIPSGLFADKRTSPKASVIHATWTLSFEVPKLAFILKDAEEFIGELSIVPIGIHPEYLQSVDSNSFLVTSVEMHKHLLMRDRHDHKGQFGHGLLLAGKYGSMGAAVLSGMAAMRAGIGKLTAHVPHSGYTVFQTSVPEAMCTVSDYSEFIGELPDIKPYDAIAIGPGIGKAKKTRRVLKDLIGLAKAPMVLDADALNLLAENKEMLSKLPNNTILTPHLGEFERLFGSSDNEFDRLDLLRKQAKNLKVIIVLKGPNTRIAAPNGRVYFNTTGNPGLATAGSGDVLTGVILAMLAQTKNPLASAILGVYLHGLSADCQLDFIGQHAMIASDIVNGMGEAFESIFASPA